MIMFSGQRFPDFRKAKTVKNDIFVPHEFARFYVFSMPNG